MIKNLGLTLKYVINTHCHADHITSGGKIHEDMPSVKTIISEASGAKADLHIRHGDKISFGNLCLEAWTWKESASLVKDSDGQRELR